MNQVVLLLIFGALALTSCGRSPDGDNESRVCMPTATVSRASPGDQIPISGIPRQLADAETIWVKTFDPLSAKESFALITRDSTNPEKMPHLLVPLHPGNHFAGGTADFIIISPDSNPCSAFSLHIKGLPNPSSDSVANSFKQSVDLIREIIDLHAQAFAVERELLGTDIQTPLAAARFFLDHEDNPNSISHIARTGKFFVGGKYVGIDLRLMDSLFAQAETRQTLEKIRNELREIATQSSHLKHQVQALSKVSIQLDARGLSGLMQLRKKLEKSRGDLDRLDRELTAPLLVIVAASIALPQESAPAIATVLAIKSALAGARLPVAGTVALLPSRLTQLSFEMSHDKFSEIMVGPGTWRNVLVTPGGDAFDIVEFLDESFNPIQVLLGKLLTSGMPASHVGTIQEGAKEALLSVGSVSKAFQETYRDITGFPLTIYYEYPSVDITDSEWSTAWSRYSGMIDIDIGLRQYRPILPIRTGYAWLVIGNQPDKFGGVPVSSERAISMRLFAIDAIDHPSIIQTNGPGEQVAIQWKGEPTFPVTVNVACSTNEGTCEPNSFFLTYESSSNPLIYSYASGCRCRYESCIQTSFVFTYTLIDADGFATSPRAIEFVCSAYSGRSVSPDSSIADFQGQRRFEHRTSRSHKSGLPPKIYMGADDIGIKGRPDSKSVLSD